jgi:Calcineurin-like phosphoesterase
MKIAIGNHDDSYERQENPTLLKQYMTNFNLSRQFYSFDYQNVHFTALSTELPYSVGTDQYEFINDDLASAASDPNIDWIVVYYHKLAYTSPSAHHNASNELREEYHTLFGGYEVDLVLQAHNHNNERSYPIKYNSANPSASIITDNKTNNYLNPEGQIFVTVGTAGADLYEFLTKAPYIYPVRRAWFFEYRCSRQRTDI